MSDPVSDTNDIFAVPLPCMASNHCFLQIYIPVSAALPVCDAYLNSDYFPLVLLGVQVLHVLSQVDEWAFDSFELARVTEGRPLSTLGFALIRRSGITAKLRLDEGKLARWGKEARGTSRQSAMRGAEERG